MFAVDVGRVCADLLSDGLGCFVVVPGQQDDLESHALQTVDGQVGFRLDHIGHRHHRHNHTCNIMNSTLV